MNQAILIVLFFFLCTGVASADPVPSSTPSLSALSVPGSTEQPAATFGRDLYYKDEGVVSGPRAPRPSMGDYPRLLGESRLVIWIVAQQHRYWVVFVLGTLLMVTLLEVWTLTRPRHQRAIAYDMLAREWLDLVILAISVAAIFGGLLLLGFLALYPDLTVYLMTVFRPVFLVFGLLLLPFTILSYLYSITWHRWSGGWLKWLHAALGILVNVIGAMLALLGNAWSSFMMSPAGVDASGRFLGNSWHVIHTALWNPFNVHRLAGQLLCASAVLAIHAVYRTMSAATDEEKAHYDWMGAVTCGVLVSALITMPFGGYWLMREIYAYRQQMGITLLGGLLAWLGLVLVTAMGILFFAINYYLWQRIASVGGAWSLGWATKWVFGILALCMVVYITPHTMVMTPLELKNMGGQQHQVLGNYGVESAKSAAVNLMILVTAWSFVLWRFCRNSVPNDRTRRLLQLIAVGFLVAGTNILLLGIYGYYLPANVRVGLSVPMVGTTFTVVLIGVAMTSQWRKCEPEHQKEWGTLSTRGYFALVAISFLVIWIMGLGGYRRSAVRLFWHVNEIMKDESPWAFTHTTGFAVNMISLNALVFLLGCAGMLWLAKAGLPRRGVTETTTSRSEAETH